MGRGYDVFLDECSVAVGADFQRELRFRLNDSDIVLLLVSPELERSTWVMDEISFANSSSIGIVGVLWPEADFQAAGKLPGVTYALASDQQYRLSATDFAGNVTPGNARTLSDAAVQAVEACVTEYRARAIRRRLLSLLPYAQAHLSNNFTVTLGAELGDLDLVDNDSKKAWLARVLPFRPTPEVLHDLYLSAQGRPTLVGAGCFYAENDPREPRAAALEWLVNANRATSTLPHYRLWSYTGKKLP